MLKFKPITKPTTDLKESIPSKDNSLLKFKTANQCIADAMKKPIPKMLFSEFWHEGEICILFADSNLGKSILATMIANSISKGIPIRGFKMEAKKQKVVYYDFEMSEKQFEKRYSENYCNHFNFDEGFIRSYNNPNCVDYDDFEKKLFYEIETAIQQLQIKILIIDNLTYLKTQSTDTSKEALPLMKKLKELTIKYDLSILALAHTPKRSCFNPITMNDLAGSKQLSNFSDSIFTIGPSSLDKSIRYIKQIKARATEIIYDSDNVILCEIKQLDNFLGFEFVDFGKELQHLKVLDINESESLNKKILDMFNENPNITQYEVAKRLNTNKMKVKRVFDKNNIQFS